jgi:hypothetical protein
MSTWSRSWRAGSGQSRRMYVGPTTPLWPRLGQGDEALRDVGASAGGGHSVSRCTSAMKSALAIDGSASSYSPR